MKEKKKKVKGETRPEAMHGHGYLVKEGSTHKMCVRISVMSHIVYVSAAHIEKGCGMRGKSHHET